MTGPPKREGTSDKKVASQKTSAGANDSLGSPDIAEHQADNRDRVLLISKNGRLLIRWFAQRAGIEALLRGEWADDDVLFIETGELRIELSVHDTADDTGRAAADLKQKFGLAFARPGGAA